MKYISFAIPCYNSAAYMDRAVESILKGGEDVEIIIVNDGSKDDTSKIAHEYEEKYPTIVRAVDKENGGHGDAVNAGLDHAEGKYFKVVDSDDWVDEEALYKILDVLKKFEEKRTYYLYDIPGGEARGGHAHKELFQLVIAASGSFNVTVDDGSVKRTFSLNRPYQGLYIVPGMWRELDNFSSGAVCLVLASMPYDEADYIRIYKDFLEYKNTK